MSNEEMYKREELKGNMLKGFDVAKEMHEGGMDIHRVRQIFNESPVSTYVNGALKYCCNKLLEERSK